MLGRLNISSLSLLVGAMGQYWFYGRLSSKIPQWIVLLILLLPWLTAFTITLCRRPPFGPRPFRLFLLFVMCWYSLLSIAAEVLNCILHLPPDGHFHIAAARTMMYIGFLCFVPFFRAYGVLHCNESLYSTTGK